MDWLTHILPIVAAFLDQHGLLSAFVLLLLEEAGVPLPVPGDVLMLVVGVRVHQAHLVLWQVLAVMEAATVLGAGILYVVSARAGRWRTGTVGFCGSTPNDSVARKTGSDRAAGGQSCSCGWCLDFGLPQ